MYFAAASLLLAVASAQTYTACNPLNSTCPRNRALGKTLDLSSFSATPSEFNVQSSDISYSNGEAVFTIDKEGQAPTLISNFYIFFGSVSIVLKAAGGTGIISSVVLESDDLDEIDLEWIGGNTAQVETNYFGKGDTSTYNRATYVAVSSPQETYHNYTINWTEQAITWLVDGAIVRTLQYSDAAGGTRYPQTPMKLRIGTWAGGDPKNAPGTIQWAGGPTDFGAVPFTMNVKSLSVVDASSGSWYEYGDESGSYQSIKCTEGEPPSDASQGNSSASTYPATGVSTMTTTSCETTTTLYTTYTPGVGNAPVSNLTTTTTAAAGAGSPTSAGPTPTPIKTGGASAIGASGVALFGAIAAMLFAL